MLWVSVLNYLYWVSGDFAGGLLGNVIPWNIKGIGFCYDHHVCGHDSWAADEGKTAHYSGDRVLYRFYARILFGADNFLLPTMFLILLLLTWAGEED